MGILSEYNLNDLPEVGPVPAGEYEVFISKAEDYIGKESGKASIRVIFDIPSEVNADSIFFYLGLPSEQDTEKQRVQKLRRIKDFLNAFQLDQEAPYTDWIGHGAWALVNQEPDNRGETRNGIKRFIGPTSTLPPTPILGSDEIPF